MTQALSIFKDSVAQWSPSRQSDESAVLNKGFVEEAVQIIITRLLPLNEADLEKWSEDPEEWINAEESDSDAWEYGVRVGDYFYSWNFEPIFHSPAVCRTRSHDVGEPIWRLCRTTDKVISGTGRR